MARRTTRRTSKNHPCALGMRAFTRVPGHGFAGLDGVRFLAPRPLERDDPRAREDADDASPLANRKIADVEHVHFLRYVVDRVLRSGPFDIATHQVPEREHLVTSAARSGHSQ